MITKKTEFNHQGEFCLERKEAIVVGGLNSSELYQYSIKDRLWTQLKNIEIKDCCYAIYQIDENIYTVAKNGNVSSLLENKTYKFPSNNSSLHLELSKVGNKILMFDKSNDPSRSNSESKIFDPKHFIRKDLKTVVRKIDFSATEYMGMVWILGGCQSYGLQSVNSIQIYDPILDILKPSPIKMLCSRTQHSSITYKGRLYIFGGVDDINYEVLNSVEMYSPDTKKFVMMAPMKNARFRFGCCRIGNLVYVVGGRQYLMDNITSMEIYNLDNNTWSDGADFPESMLVSSACAVKHKITINKQVKMKFVEAPSHKKPFSFKLF